MALRTILQTGDEALRKTARKVTKFDSRLHELLDDMRETMNSVDGVGLAAPQVGINRCVVTIEIGEDYIELINPEIIEQSGEQIRSEGCLSVQDVTGYVVRPEKVKVRAQDRTGKWHEYKTDGYFAVAVCHETDHLKGVLFTDKIADLTPEELAALEERDRREYEEDDEEIE